MYVISLATSETSSTATMSSRVSAPLARASAILVNDKVLTQQ